MGWDERLFGALHRHLRRLFRSGTPAAKPGAVSMEALAPRLETLASLLVGERVNLRRLGLPRRFESGSCETENELVALACVARSATALRLGLTWKDDSTRALATCLAQGLISDALVAELPGARVLLDAADRLADPVRPAGRAPNPAPTDGASLLRAVEAALGAPAPVVPESFGRLPSPAEAQAALTAAPLNAGPGATGTERPGARREVRRVELGEEALDENPLTHSFEKVHTAEEYSGGNKRADGADELADHAGALDELDLREVTRSGESARSLYRTELEIDGATGDVAGERPPAAIPYDEWDVAAGRYRPAWCAVHERRLAPAAGAVGWSKEILARHRVQLQRIQADLARLAATRVWRGRQLDGPEVDPEAMADRHAALASGHQPPDRLYSNRRRHTRDLAVYLLLDGSLSTDAWVANRRVLDVAREAVVVFGEALRTERIETAVAVFHSHTRQDCRFDVAKSFDEPWTVVAGRLAGLRPEGYTRIGPAIRHASRRLVESGSHRKLLVLVSDAKPTDYDRYEGRHGIADVAKSVQEARTSGIIVHGLAIDARSREHLPRMFGRGGYEVLPRPDALAGALSRVFEALAR